MSYLGGKANCAEHILELLNDEAYDGLDYLEPFVGYAHILRRVERKRSYAACDANPLLIRLLRAVQRDERLPTVSRAEYGRLREQTGVTLRRAVAAFTYSFNGKEWGGYTGPYVTNGQHRHPTAERRRYYARLADAPAFADATLRCCSYAALRPHHKLIYCDPPYRGTEGYGDLAFDHDHFWATMRKWAKNNIVFVSEYAAPADFVCVAQQTKAGTFAGGTRDHRVERVFVHRSLVRK